MGTYYTGNRGWRLTNLGVVLVEDPDLAVGGRSRYPVPIIVEEYPLVVGIPPQLSTCRLDVMQWRIDQWNISTNIYH